MANQCENIVSDEDNWFMLFYLSIYLQFANSAISAGGPTEQVAGLAWRLLHSSSGSDVVGEVEGVVTAVVVVGILVVLEWQIEFSLQLES